MKVPSRKHVTSTLTNKQHAVQHVNEQSTTKQLCFQKDTIYSQGKQVLLTSLYIIKIIFNFIKHLIKL